ncbi:MAG: family 4 glycosyl hydrolase [Candidatus Helarchaeota archaeon]
MKIVYIGAGSFRFGYGLFKNLCAMAKLLPLDVWLVDINEPLLALMAKFLLRMRKIHKVEDMMNVQMTTDRRKALENADIVLNSISVGQQASDHFDIHIPQKFGIPQNTGDTVGPGGIFRTLRCAPVVLEFIKDHAEICPDALHLNYTNPQAALVLAGRQHYPQVETCGVCHELYGGMKILHKFLKKIGRKKIPNWEQLDITYVGVNHFVWPVSCQYEGEDLYPLIRVNAEKGYRKMKRPFNWHLLQKYGYFCYPGSRHIAEFMPEYYNHFNHLEIAKKWKMPKLRSVWFLRNARRAVYWYYRQVGRGFLPCPHPTTKGERVNEICIDWMESKAYSVNPSRYIPLNIPNKGHKYVSNLPENCILELTSYFKDGHVEAKPIKKFPQDIANILRIHAENTVKFVDAALSGDPDRLLKAFLADPMCQFIEDEDALEDLMWNMLYYEQQWLPKFKESIPTKEDLQKLKHYVSEDDLKDDKIARKVKWPPKESLKEKAFFPD